MCTGKREIRWGHDVYTGEPVAWGINTLVEGGAGVLGLGGVTQDICQRQEYVVGTVAHGRATVCEGGHRVRCRARAHVVGPQCVREDAECIAGQGHTGRGPEACCSGLREFLDQQEDPAAQLSPPLCSELRGP